MQKQIFLGNIFHLTGDPLEGVEGSYEYYENGAMLVLNGKVSKIFNSLEAAKKENPDAKIHDYSDKFIFPGLIDTHIHYPQTEMIGAYGEQLLQWLEKHTFPTEAKFHDKTYCEKIAKIFLDQLLINGTTTALVLPTVHKHSVDAFFEKSNSKNLRMICGKVLMDRNAPDNLKDTAQSAYDESKELIERWHNKDRLSYAVTPRFAPTSTDEQLNQAAKLLEEYPDVYLHTHLAENHDEIKWVKELFPHSKSYLDVYHHRKLTGKRSIFAHCLHLEEADYQILKETNSTISFCPSSNFFLGSGLFKHSHAKNYGIKIGIGTDVGAGTSFSMIETMKDAYKAIQLQKSFCDDPSSIKPLSPFSAFYMATLGGAKALDLQSSIGNFESGKEADFFILDPSRDDFFNFRFNQCDSLEEKLFTMIILANNKLIESTYILGSKYTPFNN